ncbi:hypothetical protein L2D08_19995 [Domibacillus sp. PGB-M46]|uniref:hypothetical protein n=1 Tax=Domibacillus sp. PGB-M46 TaxID=2910255 RepID=UPI001F5A71ED|nr:hypothetical protein [Domibacillus sp. PGB-M46]MCI2256621.1 hypothetical protein [Domibacillus sp. PGB-M46]
MDFPTIHTNFWDAVTAVPLVMILTQIIKLKFKPPKAFVPTVALVIGLLIAVFISHPYHLSSGLFMGWFYGYAAAGLYASLKANVISFFKNFMVRNTSE